MDLIPDFIPFLGYLDDVLFLPALVALTVKLIPKEVWSRSKRNAKGMWEKGKPKRWYYAIPIVIVWCILLLVVIKIVWF